MYADEQFVKSVSDVSSEIEPKAFFVISDTVLDVSVKLDPVDDDVFSDVVEEFHRAGKSGNREFKFFQVSDHKFAFGNSGRDFFGDFGQKH